MLKLRGQWRWKLKYVSPVLQPLDQRFLLSREPLRQLGRGELVRDACRLISILGEQLMTQVPVWLVGAHCAGAQRLGLGAAR